MVVFLLLLLRKALTVYSKLSWNSVAQADLRSSCLSLPITGIPVWVTTCGKIIILEGEDMLALGVVGWVLHSAYLKLKVHPSWLSNTTPWHVPVRLNIPPHRSLLSHCSLLLCSNRKRNDLNVLQLMKCVLNVCTNCPTARGDSKQFKVLIETQPIVFRKYLFVRKHWHPKS